MPTLLDEHLLTSSLAALPGWSGTGAGIERTVSLTADQDAELRRRVAAEADLMDHHPDVEEVSGGTRYLLTTHSAGGVTELDVALASRITGLLLEVTGQDGHTSLPRPDAYEVDADPQSTPDDAAQPTVGVPSASAGTPQTPLPDDVPAAPEPGTAPEQDPGPMER